MLDMDISVMKGAMIIKLEGCLDDTTFRCFEKELDYLIYKQGMHFFIFDFNWLNIDLKVIDEIRNKLIEIFLTCGKVAFYGVSNLFKKMIGKGERIIYVNEFMEAVKYFSI